MAEQLDTGQEPEVIPFTARITYPLKETPTLGKKTRSSATQERPAGSPLESIASKKANNIEPESQSLNSDSESDIDKKGEAQITLDETFRQNTLDGVLVSNRLQGSITTFKSSISLLPRTDLVRFLGCLSKRAS